ncbi:MAG: hypothetical protein ACI8P9_003264 [Parasphingorhabdus sp.]|jgi:hypothetical protein
MQIQFDHFGGWGLQSVILVKLNTSGQTGQTEMANARSTTRGGGVTIWGTGKPAPTLGLTTMTTITSVTTYTTITVPYPL